MAQVDFAREVEPILERHCVRCHGPDKSKADLRLDLRRRALAGSEGGTRKVIVPGDALGSPLYQRVVVGDENERMPFDAEPLDATEIATLRAWIEQGAPWPDEHAGADPARSHWAYSKPVRPAPPQVADADWARHPIDAFVAARLEREGLAHAPRADRATLLRRLSLDLIGLPPTLDELDAFVTDEREDAYERAVDRLLASPHYGERMARVWLDLARYADTQGYEKDARRTMWRWRDWVIDAFNANQPFDRFTIEQLAGDLLPGATLAQQIATGFHRNTMLNEEGGTDAEEFRVDAVIDRVNTTATVWMGTTLACAQCHEHKFDPFSQRDYYRLFAVFNSTADGGRDSPPSIAAPSPSQELEDRRLARETATLEAELEAPDAALDLEQRRWEESALASLAPPTSWRTLLPLEVGSRPRGVELAIESDGSVRASGPNPDQVAYDLTFAPAPMRANLLRLEALADERSQSGGPGRAENGNFVLSTLQASLQTPGSAPVALGFVAAEGDVEQRPGPYRAAQALDASADTGWAIDGDERGVDHSAVFVIAGGIELDGRTQLLLTLRHDSKYARHTLGRLRISLADDAALAQRMTEPSLSPWRAVGPFTAASAEAARDTAFPPESEHLQRVDYSAKYGELGWTEHADWRERTTLELDGERCATYLERRIAAERARKVELFFGGDDAIRVWLDGELVHHSDDYQSLQRQQDRVEVDLHPGENRLLCKVVNNGGAYGFYFDLGRKTADRPSAVVERALRCDAAARSPDEAGAVRDYFRRAVSVDGRAKWARLQALRAEHEALAAAIPTTLVMAERAEPRETRVFARGSFLTPGERVEPGIPELFGELACAGEPARLAFARWLVSGDNPLVARVTVNRLWEQLFGRGLVATPEDFGTRSEPPTHPELLDWLAVEFMERGWDVKALVRGIVTSQTYQQSSHASAQSLERDPLNALCSRGARFRVEGEMVRDIALAASGLLVRDVGGPSVFPPQPPGMWNSAYSADDWKDDAGSGRWRRGLYTFWKRTAPYATFALFEAPSREVTCTRRARTNTPLQALALLDDPAFVEAHVALARRMLREAGPSDAERVRMGMRVCTAREPDSDELEQLVALVRAARDEFAAAPELARQRVGTESSSPDSVLVAAWTSVASVLLNLDETVTR